MVDDGSNSNTAELCDKIANSDSQIKVIHQANQGVSVARNTGITYANGEYVMFVDADDILLPNTLNEGVNYVQDYQCDLVIGGVCKITPDEVLENDFTSNKDVKLYNKDNIDELRTYYMTMKLKNFRNISGRGYIGRGPWARLIRKDVLTRTTFPIGLALGEDVVWNMRLVKVCKTICVVKSIWYGYVIYNSSAVRKYYGNRISILDCYMRMLYDENSNYIDTHIYEYSLNMAREFYGLVMYEYLSPQLQLRLSERVNIVRHTLNKNPWNLMLRKDVFCRFSFFYKFFITICQNKFGLILLNYFK